MPITNEAGWKQCEDSNKDGYGGACVDVAREVMHLLDERPGPFDPNDIISEADDALGTGGITGFMAGCEAQMVAVYHSRGEEFRRAWNRKYQTPEQAEQSDASGGIVNPAILTLTIPD